MLRRVRGCLACCSSAQRNVWPYARRSRERRHPSCLFQEPSRHPRRTRKSSNSTLSILCKRYVWCSRKSYWVRCSGKYSYYVCYDAADPGFAYAAAAIAAETAATAATDAAEPESKSICRMGRLQLAAVAARCLKCLFLAFRELGSSVLHLLPTAQRAFCNSRLSISLFEAIQTQPYISAKPHSYIMLSTTIVSLLFQVFPVHGSRTFFSVMQSIQGLAVVSKDASSAVQTWQSAVLKHKQCKSSRSGSTSSSAIPTNFSLESSFRSGSSLVYTLYIVESHISAISPNLPKIFNASSWVVLVFAQQECRHGETP